MANKALVGEKVGMTQVWDEDNRVVPVTVLRVQPNRVVQVKTTERDGYSALQVTFGRRDEQKFPRPEAGHFQSAGVQPGVQLLELRLDDVSEYEVGQELTVEVLAEEGCVDVTSVSKGKGFAGVMKRHNFKGLVMELIRCTVNLVRLANVPLPLEFSKGKNSQAVWGTRKLLCRTSRSCRLTRIEI